jgi:hypothetical protein
MQHRETHHSSSIYDGYVFHKPAGRGSAASSPQARLLLRWAQRARQRVRLIDDECALQCDGVTAGSLSTSRRRTRSHRMGRRAHGGAHHGQLGAVEQLAAESNALRPRGGGHASVRGRAPLSHGPHRKASRSSSTGPPAAVVCAMLRCGEARTRTRQLAVAASSSPLSASLSTLTGVSVFCVWCSSRSVVWVAGGASWRCPRTHDFAHRLSEVNVRFTGVDFHAANDGAGAVGGNAAAAATNITAACSSRRASLSPINISPVAAGSHQPNKRLVLLPTVPWSGGALVSAPKLPACPAVPNPSHRAGGNPGVL